VTLMLTGRRAPELHSLARELGAQAIVCDLAEREDVERLLASAGRVDLFVANAALPASGRLGVLEQVHVDRALEVNLRAPIAIARALVQPMTAAGGGHIVLVGSVSGRAASGGASVYNATKFGLRGFALALRAELAPRGVGVSLVAPGFVRDAGMFADTKIRLPPWIRTRTPEQVAEAVLRAMRENRAELTVAPPLERFGAIVAQLAPELAARLARYGGAERLALEFERRQADKR
jgi:short-subunit dehydrogenase